MYRGRGGGSSSRRGSKQRCRNVRDEDPPTVDEPSLANDPPLDLELDESSAEWFASTKRLWSMLKASPAVTKTLREYFASRSDPYESVLRLKFDCAESKDVKQSSLPYHVVDEFDRWLRSIAPADRPRPTLDAKLDAFRLVDWQKKTAFAQLVARVYEFESDKDAFVPHVRRAVREFRYKEACHMATVLKLHDRVDVEDFVVPLILQDKLFVAEEFLAGDRELQFEVVRYLDSSLDKGSSVVKSLRPAINRLNVPHVKYDKLYSKPVRKLLTRLMKIYDLPDDLAPNLKQKKNEGLIQFLVQKRFVANSIGGEGWSEMVHEVVRDDPSLRREFVRAVASYDAREASRWAAEFDVDVERLPHAVRASLDDDENRTDRSDDGPSTSYGPERPEERRTEYLTFPLDFSCIELVADGADFAAFLERISNDTAIVGIDSEWKPCFRTRQNELALMQIATRDRVFVLDVMTLKNRYPELWKKLGSVLFNNVDTLKLGFGLHADMKMVRESLPYLGNVTLHGPGYLDINVLWKELMKSKNFRFPYAGERVSGSGLSALVEICFDRKLDKSDQFSNWERRPLRRSQLTYAALDAYCLIQVYDVLNECATAHGICFDDVCYAITYKETSSVRKKCRQQVRYGDRRARGVGRGVHRSSLSQRTPAKSIRFVCDATLRGLAVALRQNGIDATLVAGEHARIAVEEDRYVLVDGSTDSELYARAPPGRRHRVTADTPDRQVEEIVTNYNIVVGEQDMFSRCRVCNCDEFDRIDRSVVEAAAIDNRLFESYDANGRNSDFLYGRFDEAKDLRSWNWIRASNIKFHADRKGTFAPIRAADVPANVLDALDLFYACSRCGKVYWDEHDEATKVGR